MRWRSWLKTGGIQPGDIKREALALFSGRRRTQTINARPARRRIARWNCARVVGKESQSGNIVVSGRWFRTIAKEEPFPHRRPTSTSRPAPVVVRDEEMVGHFS